MKPIALVQTAQGHSLRWLLRVLREERVLILFKVAGYVPRTTKEHLHRFLGCVDEVLESFIERAGYDLESSVDETDHDLQKT